METKTITSKLFIVIKLMLISWPISLHVNMTGVINSTCKLSTIRKENLVLAHNTVDFIMKGCEFAVFRRCKMQALSQK
jgi:hypothetical protein